VTQPYLDVKELRVQFSTEDGVVHAVDGVTFSVEQGKTLAIVGESGSGKSVTSLAIMGLAGKNADVGGEIIIDGQDMLGASKEEMRAIRGKKVAMIFQDPLSSLHPFYTIGDQLVEAIKVHGRVGKKQARKRTVAMLDRVGIPNASRRFDEYPHQLSGGMRQRVVIAMGLINNPSLIIADEPTTALDVTVQAQILELLKDLQQEYGAAILIITHDLGVVANVADEVAVMYGGRLVEQAPINEIFYAPEMPYTLGLLASIPRLDVEAAVSRLDPIPGQPPSLISLPKGCVFRPRCTYFEAVPDDRCDTERPELLPTTATHSVRCHLVPSLRRQNAATALAAVTGAVL
jgi:peptide/nickel transport system ATP-binding protein